MQDTTRLKPDYDGGGGPSIVVTIAWKTIEVDRRRKHSPNDYQSEISVAGYSKNYIAPGRVYPDDGMIWQSDLLYCSQHLAYFFSYFPGMAHLTKTISYTGNGPYTSSFRC